MGKHQLPDKGYNGYKSRSYFLSQFIPRTRVGIEKLVCVCKLDGDTQECIFRTASLDGNALTNEDSFDFMPIKMFLPRLIPMQMCFESQFCQSCPDVSFLHCQLLRFPVFADSLCQLNVFVHSYVPQSLLIISASLMYFFIPLPPTASLPLYLWKSSFLSTSTPKLCLTQECMSLLLFQPGWQYSTEEASLLAPNVSTCFSPESSVIFSLTVSIQSFLFSLLFFPSLLIFFHKYKWGFKRPVQYNYHLTWG